MDYFKKIERSVTISADKRSTVDLQVDVWSQDLNVTKFILKLDTTDSAAIDLTNATVRVAMVYSQDDQDVKIEAAGIVEDVATQKIAYVMSDRLAGFEGQVTAGFYVTLNTGQKIDIQNVTFNMRKSLLDKDLEPAKDSYYQTFDDIVTDVNGYADSQKQAIDSVVSDVQSVGDTAKEDIKATLPTLKTQVSQLSESIVDISDNLSDFINTVSEEDNEKINLELPFTKGGYISLTSGNFVPHDYCQYGEVTIPSDADVVKLYGHTWYLVALLMFKDADGNIIYVYPTSDQGAGTYVNQTIDIPNNAVKAIYSTNSTQYSYALTFEKKGYSIEKSVKKVTDNIIGEMPKDFIDKTSDFYTKDGFYIVATTGRQYPNDDSVCTDFISVNENDRFKLTGFAQYSACGVAFFDENKAYRGSFLYDENGNAYTFVDAEITIPSGIKYIRCSSYMKNAHAYGIKKLSTLSVSEVENRYSSVIENGLLYKKKWTACGDSFTAGDFNGYVDSEGHTGVNSDAYDKSMAMYKTYPWWIAKRNNMSLNMLAQSGNDFTNVSDAVRPFSAESTPTYNYKNIPVDSDYITISFGLNELGIVPNSVGTSQDTSNTTLWGAYNVVLGHICSVAPNAKVGIIIADGWMTNAYRETIKTIAKYWGVPVLDLNDDDVPFYTGIRSSVGESVKAIKNNIFAVKYGTNNHPNLKAHELRSTVIESWLRTL